MATPQCVCFKEVLGTARRVGVLSSVESCGSCGMSPLLNCVSHCCIHGLPLSYTLPCRNYFKVHFFLCLTIICSYCETGH